jgi:DtxR family Mn-dependent transcriptional regulator
MNNPVSNLSSTMEDYLETIFSLKEENGFARVGEIAEKMKVKSPSVNSAIKALAEQGLVVHEKYGCVSLTAKGNKLAADVKNKHEMLYRFLTEFLMLDPARAEQDACCIEHAISEEAFQRLAQFFQFLETGLQGDRPRIVKLFEDYLRTGKKQKCSCSLVNE